jgi:flavin reductase (DIM6/NTAB) family NADH-FMN oxidoreductase RutF
MVHPSAYAEVNSPLSRRVNRDGGSVDEREETPCMAVQLEDLIRALDLTFGDRFVLTSACEHKRGGVFVTSAQPCGRDPPLLCVACLKGHPLDPIIRDSNTFAVCRISTSEKLLARKFVFEGDGRGDPFDSLEVERLVTGSPVLRRAKSAVDCQVIRHLDLDGDHQLYIGQALAVRV